MSAYQRKSSGSAKAGKKGKAASISSEDLQRLLKPASEAEKKIPFAQVLKAAGIRSPIILFGNQHIRTKRIIEWIKERFFSDAGSDYAAYFGSELTNKKNCEPILQSLLSQSLFSKETLIVIYDSDSVKAAGVKELADKLATPSDSAIVILTAEDAEKKTSLAGTLGANATRVEISELSGSILQRWVEKEASRFGAKGFEAGAVPLLIQYYGSDTTLLTREIEKLALLTEPGALVSKALVQQLSFQNPEITSFELIEKIARKDARAACVQALTLVDQGMHPMQLSHFISRCIRTALARGATDAKEQLATEFTNYWFTKNLGSAERAFNERDASYLLETLRELDFNLKDSKLDDRLALSIAVERLATRGAAAA
jgi:DNA polymerase III delta subunit